MHLYRQLLDSVTLATVQEPQKLDLPDEISLQSLWFAGQFGQTFQTTDGRRVSVIQFGFWNRSAGPDFLNAAVEIDGETLSGPIEIDTRASDWESHGHSTNPAFEKVCLHVIFEQPNQTTFIRTHEGREILCVIVPREKIEAALAAPKFASAPAHVGRCATPLADLSADKVTELMLSAAKHRLAIKARRLQNTIEAVGFQEALWQGLARTLGYRVNSLAFTQLAQKLPITALQKDRQSAEALIFGTAGFLTADLHEKSPEHSRNYLRELWDRWWAQRQNYEPSAERVIHWQMHGVRPSNHPHRRLGALAALAENWTIFHKACGSATDFTEIIEMFATLEHPFWSRQYTLLSKQTNKRVAIFGKARAIDFVTNILVPLRDKDALQIWEPFCQLPASAPNEKVAKALVRLFGKREDAKMFAKKAWQQQALLQIYDDFCLTDTSDCDNCLFPDQLRDFLS